MMTGRHAGFVSLVGAGPGDPELLTRRALSRLEAAELVLYDALVPGAIVALASRARRFYVGKRAGRHSLTQEAINALMVRAARRGLRVVRLKSGDPFVLGRGGEEALALRAAGVPFEVVPGISAAVAAPALAGVPVTHRGVASSFAVVSGHAPDAYRPALESLAPGSMTLVVLMGLGWREDLVECLLSRGWAPNTPAAIVFGAFTDEEFVWRGRLADLASATQSGEAPGTIVIGKVVALGELIGSAVAPGFSRADAGLNAGATAEARSRHGRG